MRQQLEHNFPSCCLSPCPPKDFTLVIVRLSKQTHLLFLDNHVFFINATLVSTIPTGESKKQKRVQFRALLQKNCSIFTTLYGTNFSFIPPEKKNTGRPQTIETFAVIKAILYCLTRLDWHMFRFSWEAFNCNQQLHLFWEKYRFSVGFQKASIYSRTPELWLEWNTKSSIYRGGGVQVFTRWWSRDDFFPSRVFFPAKHRSTASLHLFTLP